MNFKSLTILQDFLKRIEGFDVFLFKRKPKKVQTINRVHTGQPARTGKKRINTRRTGAANRRFEKRQTKLRSAGYKMGSSKPINHLSVQEFRKFNKKISSGKYEVRKMLAPPKWVNESPREWVMIRKK